MIFHQQELSEGVIRDRLRSYENGANSFVNKPLEFSEFAETVARLGVYWLITSKPAPTGI
jgi:hypothetical protein